MDKIEVTDEQLLQIINGYMSITISWEDGKLNAPSIVAMAEELLSCRMAKRTAILAAAEEK